MKNKVEEMYDVTSMRQAQADSETGSHVLIMYYRPTMTPEEYLLVGRLIDDLRAGGIDVKPDEINDVTALTAPQPVQESEWTLLVQTADIERSAQLEERLRAAPETARSKYGTKVLRVFIAPESAQQKRLDLMYPSTFDASGDYPRALAGIMLALGPERQDTFYGVKLGAAPPLPRTRHKHRRLFLGIGIIALTALLILGILVTNLLTSTFHSNGTVVGTHNGKVRSPSPDASPSQMLYEQVTSKPPVIDDPLQVQNANGWDILPSAFRTCTFQPDGSYHVKAMRPREQNIFIRTVCLEGRATFLDFAVQVDMKLLQGSVGGVVFRAQGRTTYYWFSLDSHACYELVFSPPSTVPEILSPKTSNCLPLAMQSTIQLTVIAQGVALYLYINGHFVYHTNDMSLTAPGQLGLLALDRPDNPAVSTDVAFTHMKVWEL